MCESDPHFRRVDDSFDFGFKTHIEAAHD